MYRLSYLANMFFIAILPLVCRALALQANHSRAYFSTISGNYMLSPERWVFGIGVSLFIGIYLGYHGMISPRVLNGVNSIKSYASTLEIAELGLFLLIAWIPAHLILGMHALLGGMLFTISTLWIQTIAQHAPASTAVSYTRHALVISAVVCLIGMIAHFPADLIGELVHTKPYSQERYYLLGMDARWDRFAIFEWLLFYSVIAFMTTCCP